MKKTYIIMFIFVFSLLTILASCGGGSSSTQSPRYNGENNEILAYSFTSSGNNSLGIKTDVAAEIKDNSITLQVPYAASVTNLIAEFVSNSTNIKVNNVAQKSGITLNDFTNPVKYTVYADNENKREYIVIVTKAPNTEKKISSYSINGIPGTIDQDAGTIIISLPPHTAVNSLAASFSAIGKSITANNGIIQETGVTLNNFTGPVIYIVTADDNSSRQYTVTATVEKATTKNISYFAFLTDSNPFIGSDITGIITGKDIQVVIPYGISRDNLVAYFTTDGETVKIGETIQEYGVTSNDFTNTKTYTVTAEDGTSNEYTITVSVAKSDAKAITQFYLDGEKGTINESAHTITVNFEASKILTNLTADFVNTGVIVEANSNPQVSGITMNDFTNPVVYTVTADDGSKQPYTVTAVKDASITGLWNFEYGTDGSYTVTGTATVPGPTGSALQFNGQTDYVKTPDSDSLTLANGGTIEVVVKAITHRPYAGIVHKGIRPDFADETYSLQFWGAGGTDGTVRFLTHNTTQDANNFSYVDSNTKLGLNIWYHLVATWSPTELVIYINGVRDVNLIADIGQIRDSDGGLVIGAQIDQNCGYSDWGDIGFNGIIDRVQIFNHTLTAEEALSHYQNFLSSAGSGFTAYLLLTANRHMNSITAVLGVIILLLFILYLYNRKRTKTAEY
jgi:hypothetical protein